MRTFLYLSFCLASLQSWSQVGINTTKNDPGAILHVMGDGTQGVLLTRSNIIDLNTEAPLPSGIEDGTLTFNTNTTSGMGYLWWDQPTNTWRYVDPFLGKKAQFRNSVTDGAAGDLNQPFSANFQVPTMGSTVFNESNVLYQSQNSGRAIRIAADGRYRIMATLGIESQEDLDTDNDHNIIEVMVKVTNGTTVTYPGARQHSTEMEDNDSNQDDDGSVSFVEVLELKANDVISLHSYRSSLTGNNTVWMNPTRPSSFFIIKIN